MAGKSAEFCEYTVLKGNSSLPSPERRFRTCRAHRPSKRQPAESKQYTPAKRTLERTQMPSVPCGTTEGRHSLKEAQSNRQQLGAMEKPPPSADAGAYKHPYSHTSECV